MKFFGIIPARYASTRFPGKPLAIIDGKSMIQRVYEQAKKSFYLHDVIVATDDKRIFDHVISFQGKVVMTSNDHPSGTDRCFEAILKENLFKTENFESVCINIQGDEPYIQPEQIDTLASCFLNPEVDIATLIKKISKPEDLMNPNVVKVVKDLNNMAIYFSRSPIPYLRNNYRQDWLKNFTFYKHLGIYAYRLRTLAEITKLKTGDLEKAESLEQLRWLENSYQIFTERTEFESIAIDTTEDLEKLGKA